jgi:bifunctional UDP-N-acetylglucosamine pyrophosphorylase/glucosamine-1-phosphate N-acetyltransferase
MAVVSARSDRSRLSAVVLAAGEGKRMRSGRAKVLHEVGGRALIDHVLAALETLAPSPLVVVVGHLRAQLEAHLAGRGVVLAVQDPPRGTGDAVGRALPLLPEAGETLVVSGDVPLVTPATLEALVELRRRQKAAAALVTAVLSEPGSYGRIVRDGTGNVSRIVEARDASDDARSTGEVNAGTYVFDVGALRRAIGELRPDNDQGEYYLTDVVGILTAGGLKVAALPLADPAEMAGVNSRSDLSEVHRLLNRRIVRRLQEAGVTVLDPETTWVDADCTVGRDSELEAGVHLRGGCVIGERCRIGAHSVLDGATVADGTAVPPLSFRSCRG